MKKTSPTLCTFVQTDKMRIFVNSYEILSIYNLHFSFSPHIINPTILGFSMKG